MKTFKAIVFTAGLGLILGFAGTGNAQQSGSSGESGSSNAAAPSSKAQQSSKSTGKLDAEAPENDDALHLTDEQKDKIKSIREDAKQKVLDVQKDSSLSNEAKEHKVREIRKETRAQVWGAMTPDQQQQWANEQRARREARRADSKPQD
jgi:Spy/CpxP family protein refolding chaperone